jgi:hypothetical protein
VSAGGLSDATPLKVRPAPCAGAVCAQYEARGAAVEAVAASCSVKQTAAVNVEPVQ